MEQSKQDVQKLIEEYNRRMLELHQRRQPDTPPAKPTDEPFREPQVLRDLAAMAPVADPVAEPNPAPAPQTPTESPSPSTPPPFVGYLRVYVFSGDGAEPLEGARVAVSRRDAEGEVLYANATTDRDGFSPVIPLPTVDPALSMQPDNGVPYITYTILVNAAGYTPSEYSDVPVYGNTYVTQPAAMVPLVTLDGSDDTRRFRSGGPTNL